MHRIAYVFSPGKSLRKLDRLSFASPLKKKVVLRCAWTIDQSLGDEIKKKSNFAPAQGSGRKQDHTAIP